MSYKLNSIIEKVISPVRLILPDGNLEWYRDGMAASDAIFHVHYIADSIRAVDGVLEIRLIEASSPDGEEGFF